MENNNENKVVENYFKGKLIEYNKNQTPVMINEMGLSKIDFVADNYITISVYREEKEIVKPKKDDEGKKAKAVVKMYKEIIQIPIDKINLISEGEKEIQTTKEEEQDNDLLDEI